MSGDEPSVTIQGEVHISQRDKRNLLSHGLENYDALIVEGRDSTIDFDGRETAGFELFVTGFLTYQLLILRPAGCVWRVVGWLPGIDLVDLERSASDSEIEYHNEIDKPLHEIYDLIGRRTRIVSISVLFMIIAYIGASTMYETSWTLSDPLLVFATASVPFIYMALLVLGIAEQDRTRDDVMTDRIERIVRENDYESVLILCGDKHVNGITENLDELGWDTESHKSKSPIGRFRRLFT